MRAPGRAAAPAGRPSGGTTRVAAHVLASVPEHGRVLVAVDGVGASGKTTFAAVLAENAVPRPVVLVHADDYMNPAEVRHARGRFSAEGFWLDTYDYDALIAAALDPLRRTGDGRHGPAARDGAARTTGTGARSDLVRASTDALIVVEGTFLHRDELAHFWDYSVFLDVPVDEANRRMTARGGLDPTLAPALLRRYNGAQALYFASARPWERASLVVDNTDPGNPRVIDGAAAHAAR